MSLSLLFTLQWIGSRLFLSRPYSWHLRIVIVIAQPDLRSLASDLNLSNSAIMKGHFPCCMMTHRKRMLTKSEYKNNSLAYNQWHSHKLEHHLAVTQKRCNTDRIETSIRASTFLCYFGFMITKECLDDTLTLVRKAQYLD